MSSKFEVYEDSAGQFRFRLKAANGVVVARSEGFATRDSAVRGCRSLVKAAEDSRVVVATDSSDATSQQPPAQRNGAGDSIGAARPRTSSDADRSVGSAESGPVGRRFRFAGGMSADSDLAARSGDVLRDELRHDT